MPSSYGVILLSLILLLFLATETTSTHANGFEEVDKVAPLVPVIEHEKLKSLVMMNETRRKLGSFQICALCTCCGGPKGLCLPSPCCYAINCNISNRPYGFCSFTPKTCSASPYYQDSWKLGKDSEALAPELLWWFSVLDGY